MKKISTILVASSVLITGGATAQSILSWDVAGVPATNSLPATTIAENLDLSSGLNQLGRVGVAGNATVSSFSSTGWNITDSFDENDKYVNFTLQASPGYEMTLTSLDSVVWGSNTAPKTARWGYRVGTGSFVLSDTFDLTATVGTSSRTWDFVDFTTSEAVEFRFWAYGTISITNGVSSTGGAIRVPGNSTAGIDLGLNGSVAVVPEPRTSLLLALGVCLFVGASKLYHLKKVLA